MKAGSTPDIRQFIVAGVNYKKTDAALRGLYAVNNEQYEQLLSGAGDHGIHECFVLSTCNRTEIYGLAEDAGMLMDLLCSVTAGEAVSFAAMAYVKQGQHAVEHIFHVGAGLDSQILGDYEILGQIKNAVKQAKNRGFVGAFTERLINSVLQASKAIKTHTALSGGTVSTSFAAVQYIREYFEGPVSTPAMKCPSAMHMMTEPTIDQLIAARPARISDKKIVLVGTGKIGRIACRNLVDYLETTNITLINRTSETAAELAGELGLRHAPITALDKELQRADIILVAASAAQPIVLPHHLEGHGQKLVIDFSVPCVVAADAQVLPDVKFVDVDMLSKIKDETLALRQAEVPKAVAIIDELIEDFNDWCDMRRHVPVLKEVKKKLKSIDIQPGILEGQCPVDSLHATDEKIQKVINSLATRIRKDNTPGCHYILAINEYMS